jgi:hypothetical protein
MIKIKEEASLWAQTGALGLCDALPMTWDVHYGHFSTPYNPHPRRLVKKPIFSMK